MTERYPDFIVIGAQKAGTTALHAYLRDNIELGVWMPANKELNYFVKNGQWPKGDGWYAAQFSESLEGRCVGEISPNYARALNADFAAVQMAKLLPDAKLVFVARDPVARTISAYNHYIATGLINCSLELALNKYPFLLNDSYYWQCLQPFIEQYGEKSICVLDSSWLRTKPSLAIQTLVAHLGLRPPSNAQTVKEKYASSQRVRPNKVIRWLTYSQVFLSLRKLLPVNLKRWLWKKTSKPIDKQTISPALEQSLRLKFADDVAAMSKFAKVDFAAEWDWK